MKPGGAIINTSVNSDMPNPMLLAYATTEGAIQNFTGGLAQMLAAKGIRANAVAPGPIWTPLILSTMPEEAVKTFGKQTPFGRAGQPAELATAYVMLADPPIELHVRNDGRRHGRQAVHLIVAPPFQTSGRRRSDAVSNMSTGELSASVTRSAKFRLARAGRVGGQSTPRGRSDHDRRRLVEESCDLPGLSAVIPGLEGRRRRRSQRDR